MGPDARPHLGPGGSRWRPTPTSPRRRAAGPAPATPARPGRGGDQRERRRPHPPAFPQGRGVRRRHRRGGGEGLGPAGRQAGGDAGVEDPRGGGGGAAVSGIGGRCNERLTLRCADFRFQRRLRISHACRHRFMDDTAVPAFATGAPLQHTAHEHWQKCNAGGRPVTWCLMQETN